MELLLAVLVIFAILIWFRFQLDKKTREIKNLQDFISSFRKDLNKLQVDIMNIHINQTGTVGGIKVGEYYGPRKIGQMNHDLLMLFEHLQLEIKTTPEKTEIVKKSPTKR